MNCKWNGRGNPRVLPGRHGAECPDEALSAPESDEQGCGGCLPCPERHCAVCQRAHGDVCPECIASTRDDLAAIRLMCGALPAEVEHRGINGEAMMLLGPSADPEAWRNRAMSAMRGRVDAGYLDDCRDEQHPLWVLGTWEQLYREEWDQPSDLRQTIARAGDYIDRNLARMAECEEVPFEDFARDVRGCRGHLEDILRDGEQVETGAPCPKCDRALVKNYGRAEPFDRWVCPSRTCGEWFLDSEYRRWVSDDYRANSDKLTAPDLEAQYAVKASSVRAWASLGKVRKRGKDDSGRQLYDVADARKAAGQSKTSGDAA